MWASNKIYKMRSILLFVSAYVYVIGFAQITVTSSDFPVAGDTALVSSSNETTLDLVTTGPNAIWDFSTINISDQTIDTFFNVANADFLVQTVFNNTWLNPNHKSDYYAPFSGGALAQLGQFGIGIQSPMQYTKVKTDSVYNTGISFVVQGQTLPAKADTIDTQYYLPMTYGDSWSGHSYINLDLNPAFDAIYRRHQTRNTIIDGYGTITTPFGTFDAIRVKSFVSGTDSIYIGTFSTWTALPTPDQIEYQWFANGQKIPVFSVVTSDIAGNETITSIRFKDHERFFASVEENEFSARIYPNPAANSFAVSFDQIPELLEIRDVSGQLVYSSIPSSNIINIDASNWNAGLYVVQTSTTDGISSTRLIIE